MNRTADSAESLESTRRSLHAVAELLMAGPQFEQSGSIELKVSPGGFATTRPPAIRVDGGALVVGDRHVSMHGLTIAELADVIGLAVRDLRDVYETGPELGPDEPLTVDQEAAEEIAVAYGLGDAALGLLAPDRKRVLWPEHFDIGIDADDVNYGVSPGDLEIPVPYAYVGPWSFQATGGDPFWNSPYGASRPIRDLGDEAALLAFFTEGRERARRLDDRG